MSDFDLFTLIPQESNLMSREEASLATRITRKFTAKLPIIASPMSTVCETRMAVSMRRLGGTGAIHRYMTLQEQAKMVQDAIGAGAAIGANGMEKRVDALVREQANYLIGDVAHGDSKACYDLLKYIRRTYGDDVQVISPNIVTKEAAGRYNSLGIDGYRVGIGAGSVCTTRKVAGVGRNQLRSIAEIHEAFPQIPITSCGGITGSGDIVKALAAGAESVVIGRLFASADESPAPRLEDGRILYAGMASYFAEKMRTERTGEAESSIFHIRSPEGKQDILDPTGPVEKTVIELMGGVRAGMAYVGAKTNKELQQKAIWEDERGQSFTRLFQPVDWR